MSLRRQGVTPKKTLKVGRRTGREHESVDRILKSNRAGAATSAGAGTRRSPQRGATGLTESTRVLPENASTVPGNQNNVDYWLSKGFSREGSIFLNSAQIRNEPSCWAFQRLIDIQGVPLEEGALVFERVLSCETKVPPCETKGKNVSLGRPP